MGQNEGTGEDLVLYSRLIAPRAKRLLQTFNEIERKLAVLSVP
jgi:hypothetical protein